MFVVTGTPRSATGYASLLFRELQIPCTHERLFRPRTCLHEVLEWYAEGGDKAESSWLAWAFLPLLPGPLPVLHTIRNPWAVLDSLAHRNDLIPREAGLDRGKQLFRDVIGWYCPRVAEYDSALNRAAVLVVDWNQKIEARCEALHLPYRRYQVEQVEATELADILDWLGIYRDEHEITQALENVPHSVNAGRRVEYNIEIKNPLVKAYLSEVMPDVTPTLARVVSIDEHRTQNELADQLAVELRESVEQLCERYGYSGVNEHESANERATV